MKALSCPPRPSIASAISLAVREVGALEEHVLDQVGDPRLRVGLVARAGLAPEADGGGPDVADRLHEDAHAIRERVFENAFHALRRV